MFAAQMLGEPCSVVRCGVCGLIYKDLFPNQAALGEVYGDDYVHFQGAVFGAGEVISARQKLARCQSLLRPQAAPRDIKVLDIGCGSGAFVQIARQLGYQAEGIDPYLPEALEHSDGLMRKAVAEVAPASYDVAVMLNIAEHLERPREFFTAARQLLKPGGVLLMTCPLGDSLAFRLHRAHWTHLVLDEHLLFWTPAALTRLLRELGFAGKVNYRIAGSPFPYGRAALPAPPQPTASVPETVAAPPVSNPGPPRKSIQARVWSVAQAIQRREEMSNLLRQMIHLTKSGDYLEYAIAVN